jgi:hypothetical protein
LETNRQKTQTSVLNQSEHIYSESEGTHNTLELTEGSERGMSPLYFVHFFLLYFNPTTMPDFIGTMEDIPRLVVAICTIMGVSIVVYLQGCKYHYVLLLSAAL